MTPEQMQEVVVAARNCAWRYQLDGYEDAVLKDILRSVNQAQGEIMGELERRIGGPTGAPTSFAESRMLDSLDELGHLSAGIQLHLAGQIADIAGQAGSASLATHNAILSWDGRLSAFNNVSLTAEQVRELALNTPVGGRLLEDWVGRSFDSSMISGIKQEVMTGMLEGQGYPGLIKRIEDGWDMTRTEATTLTRTYVQSANVGAQQAVYRANQDFLKGEKWLATLEVGGKGGGGTCLSCAALDGWEFLYPQTPPDCPLHPRCRCVLVPITPTWREMGLDIDEMEDVYRPWTEWDKNVNAGRGGSYSGVGLMQGNFSDFFDRMPEVQQLQVVGPGRLGLLQSGQIEFKDLIDPMSGRLRLLDKVDGQVVGLQGFSKGGGGFGPLDMGGGFQGFGGVSAPVPLPASEVMERE